MDRIGSARVIVRIAGHRAVAPRQAGASAELVVAEGRQHADAGGRPVLANLRHLAGDQVIVGDVECVGPGQPGAAAGKVKLFVIVPAGLVQKLVTVPDFPWS